MFKKSYSIKFPIEESSENHFFALTQSNYEATLAKLKFFIVVKEGELLYNPRFGFGFEKYLHEQMTPDLLDRITKELKEKVKEFFPNVEIISLETDLSDGMRVLTLRITVLVNDVQSTLELNFQ